MTRALTVLLISFVFLALACQDETCAEERGLIPMQEYLDNNNLTPTFDSTANFWYTIVRPGSSARPTIDSDVTVSYEGRETNNVVFDATRDTTVRLPLSLVIPGWQLGIPLIGRGGEIILYLPSRLAYGPRGAGEAICPNSDLIFNITLESFTN